MLRIKIAAIGKDKDSWITDGIRHYEKLLLRYSHFEYDLFPSPAKKGSSEDEHRLKETELLLHKTENSYRIALSDDGKTSDSRQFAKWLESTLNRSGAKLTFIIGGPYGLERELIKNTDQIISLSPLTMSHQIVRLVLLEQLYRAFSILNNTDYHK